MMVENLDNVGISRDKVIAVKLSEKEFINFKKFARAYGLPHSTCAYLLLKKALHDFDDTKNGYPFDGLL